MQTASADMTSSRQDILFDYHCPNGLLGISLLYWAWELQALPIGIILALLVEAAPFLPWRLSLSDNHFLRIANLTSLTLLVTALSLFVISLNEGLFLLISWLPLIMSLLLLAQLYNPLPAVPLIAVVASLRQRQLSPGTPKYIDLRLPFLFLTLISTSITAERSPWFYWIAVAFILWALWPLRPRQHNGVLWAGIFLGAMSLGYAMHTGLNQLQFVVQQAATEWFQGNWNARKASHDNTAIGRIGRLKLSEKIALRVKSRYGSPAYLQQAIYNRYQGRSWWADRSGVMTLLQKNEQDLWQVSAFTPQTGGELHITGKLNNGKGLLPLPLGSYQIEYQGAGQLASNPYGAIQLENADSLLEYKVRYRHDYRKSERPEKQDLHVPGIYQKLMTQEAEKLQLGGKSPKHIVERVKQHFENNFKYSLIQTDQDIEQTPLTHFMRIGRQGHCEYFASAGTMLLRAAGIPSRYVTGFLMTEYDNEQQQFIVRNRHAHAWTLAYYQGRWHEVDFTPPDWAALEQQASPWWQGAHDVWANTWDQLERWWQRQNLELTPVLTGLALLMLIIYILRTSRLTAIKLRWVKQSTAKQRDRVTIRHSPFAQLVERLETRFGPKPPGQALTPWLRQLAQRHGLEQHQLLRLARTHYRFRFGPDSEPETAEFTRQIRQWLSAHQQHL